MNFPFVPPASNAATLRWKNWIAIHFLITGVAVLTLSGFSSVMGIWVLEDYGLTLSAPGWELMRGAKVVGEILSGLGLVLFISGRENHGQSLDSGSHAFSRFGSRSRFPGRGLSR